MEQEGGTFQEECLHCEGEESTIPEVFEPERKFHLTRKVDCEFLTHKKEIQLLKCEKSY